MALTRAEDTLLLSGHHWGASEAKPRGPSEFLCELKDIIDRSAAAGDPCGVVEHWAPAPATVTPNPLRDKVVEAVWPADPAGARRGDVDRGAALVRRAMTGSSRRRRRRRRRTGPPTSTRCSPNATARRRSGPRRCPPQLSVSSLVELGRDPDGAAQRLRRRLPTRPDPHALLGTAFHDWVQRFYGAERLFDLDDLPGAVDAELARADAEDLAELQAAFTASPWAARTPDRRRGAVRHGHRRHAWCAAASTRCSPTPTAAPRWWTGRPANRPPPPEAMRHAAVQLAVYRLAWAALQGVPAASVRAAFHYVRSGQTVAPDIAAGPDELAALLELPAA